MNTLENVSTKQLTAMISLHRKIQQYQGPSHKDSQKHQRDIDAMAAELARRVTR